MQAVLDGIDAAAQAGMQVKINMVVQKGFNDQDIVPMADYFQKKKHILRFVEFMDVGNTNGWKLDQVVSKQQIIEAIHKQMPLEPVPPHYKGEVATRYRYQDGEGEIGIISSVTDAFAPPVHGPEFPLKAPYIHAYLLLKGTSCAGCCVLSSPMMR